MFTCTVHQRLQAQVKELEQQRRFTAQQAASGSEYSPSISLTSLDNSAMSVDEGDADQAWTKYREMKVRQLAKQYPLCLFHSLHVHTLIITHYLLSITHRESM